MRHAWSSLAALLWLAGSALAGEVLPVESQVLVRSDGVDLVDRLVGRVASTRRSHLGFERGGRIASVAVRAGDRVEKGQRLASLDLRQLEAQRREVEARLGAAQADLRRIRAQLKLAAAVRKRQDDLFQRGVAAAQEHDEAVFGEQALRAQVAAGEAAIAAAVAARDTLDVAVELSHLVAPFAGTVTQRHLDEGSVVAPGAPVLSLIDRQREIRIGVPLAKAADLAVGDEYQVVVEDRELSSRLVRVVDSLDPATRTIEAIFAVGEAASIVDGAVAHVRWRSRLPGAGYWVPTAALSEGRRGLWSLLVLVGEGDFYRVERRDVSVLHARPDRAFVRGAVADGERIVVGGAHRVVPGQMVRAVDR